MTVRSPAAYTASGLAVPIYGTEPHDIDLRDIAGHLSRICRFAGATQSFYSVAQHCVLVADLLAGQGPITQLYGLLHDAHEAYVGDITTPMRRLMAAAWGQPLGNGYDPVAEIVHDLDAAIHARFGLVWPMPATTANLVAIADKRALATEVRDLLAEPRDTVARDAFAGLAAPMRGRIKPLPWMKAEERFLAKFEELAILAGLQPEVAA
jgi:hypothetical protein